MTSDSSHIAWFAEVGRDDVALVGGKGANLGELTQANIPVPTWLCRYNPRLPRVH